MIRILNRVFLVAAIGLFGWFLHAQWEDLTRILADADRAGLAAATCVLIVFPIVQAWLNARILRSLGAGVPILETMRIVLISILGKYIPGKVWIFTMRSTFFGERGVPVRTVLTAAGVEHVYVIVTGAALFLLFSAELLPGVGRAGPILGGTLLLILIFAPDLMLRVADKLLRRIGRGGIEGGLGRRQSALFTMVFLATWIMLGAGIWLLARGLGAPIPVGGLPALSGAYSASVVSGFLALFAPGGIGVREGIFALGLERWVPGSQALLIAMAARVVTSVGEALSIVVVSAAQLVFGERSSTE